jgi:hypothetical protein
MSKIMWLLGILLIAAGVALGLKSIISPGQMQIYGLTPETAAVLLIGGILSLGLGGVIDSLAKLAGYSSHPVEHVAVQPKSVIQTVGTDTVEIADDIPTRIPGFGRKTSDMATGAAAAAAAMGVSSLAEAKSTATAAVQSTTPSVADTIAALEQAKSDIKNALGGVESMTSPAETLQPIHVEPAVVRHEEPPAIEEPAHVEGELYVLEEKIIRGRPSRILSDDTVEAETDEGWMRFENLEHLNEYLDSMEVDDT